MRGDCNLIRNDLGSLLEFNKGFKMKKLVLALSALLFSVGVNAACNVKSLKGDYYFSAAGLDNGHTCANVGVVTFDGKGGFTTHTAWGCGNITLESDTIGLYDLKSNCMGVATSNNGFTYNFVLNKALTNGAIFLSQDGNIGNGALVKQ